MLDIVFMTPRFSPAVAIRIYADLGVMLHGSIVPGMPGRAALAGPLNELTPVPGFHNRAYHWPSCANSALAQGMRNLFQSTTAENMAVINALEDSTAADTAPGIPFEIAKSSASRRRRVADHILAWAGTDSADGQVEVSSGFQRQG